MALLFTSRGCSYYAMFGNQLCQKAFPLIPLWLIKKLWWWPIIDHNLRWQFDACLCDVIFRFLTWCIILQAWWWMSTVHFWERLRGWRDPAQGNTHSHIIILIIIMYNLIIWQKYANKLYYLYIPMGLLTPWTFYSLWPSSIRTHRI